MTASRQVGRIGHILSAAVIGLIAAAGFALAAQPILLWESNLEKSSAVARAGGKPMFLEFWAVDCAPCKEMDADVYSNERVVKAMDKVVPVRVDMDLQGGTARKYGVAATPTILLTDSFGNELFRFSGLLPVDAMLRLLDELPGDVARINQWSERLARNKRDAVALEALGRELRSASLYRASNRYYARALKDSRPAASASARADMLEAMGRNHVALKEYKEAARLFEQLLRESPGRPAEPDIMLSLGRALLAQDRKPDAHRILRTLADRYPAATESAEAQRLINGRDP